MMNTLLVVVSEVIDSPFFKLIKLREVICRTEPHRPRAGSSSKEVGSPRCISPRVSSAKAIVFDRDLRKIEEDILSELKYGIKWNGHEHEDPDS